MWLDLSTRQRVGFTDLSRANPALAQQWVEESKFYSLDVLAPKLRLSVADARKFVLDPGTLVASRYEDKPQEQAKDRAEYQRQMNEYDQKRAMSGVGPDKFFWKGDRVSDEEWFGLLSEEEAKSLKESWTLPGRASLMGNMRGFWRAQLDANFDHLGSKETRLLKLERVGGDDYLNGGLLRAEQEAKALRLEGPAGYLVLHHSRIGEQGALMLTRVDVSGM